MEICGNQCRATRDNHVLTANHDRFANTKGVFSNDGVVWQQHGQRVESRISQSAYLARAGPAPDSKPVRYPQRWEVKNFGKDFFSRFAWTFSDQPDALVRFVDFVERIRGYRDARIQAARHQVQLKVHRLLIMQV